MENELRHLNQGSGKATSRVTPLSLCYGPACNFPTRNAISPSGERGIPPSRCSPSRRAPLHGCWKCGARMKGQWVPSARPHSR